MDNEQAIPVPAPDPWLAAGWELDERGKPCKWKDEFSINHLSIEGATQDVRDRANESLRRCQAAMRMVEQSPETFVVRVPAEQLIVPNFETNRAVIITRCRVRWCESAEVAAHYVAFEMHTTLEVDLEQARIWRQKGLID